MTNKDIELSSYSKDRLESLADGIFAFAMTLLVINLHLPEISAIHSQMELIRYLSQQWVIILSYILSFILLGITWTGHQAQFIHLKQTNHIHNWLHILYLMTIAAIPFSTGLLGEFGKYPIAQALYGFNLLLGSLFMLLLWWWADHSGLIDETNTDRYFIQLRYRRLIIAPFVYLSAIILSFVSVFLSFSIYILMLISFIIPHKFLDKVFIKIGM